MSPAAAKKDNGLVLGGVPRADLLPPEIHQDEVAKRQRRNMVAVLVLVVFLVAVAYGAVSVQALAANAELTAAEDRGNALLQEQAEYSDVRQTQSQLAAADNNLKAASALEVDWAPVLGGLQSRLPADATITSVTTSLTALTGASSSPLYENGVWSIELVIQAPTPTDAAAFRDSLETMPGFLNAQSKSLVGFPYAYSVTLRLSDDALWARYFDTPEEAAEALQAAIDEGIVQ